MATPMEIWDGDDVQSLAYKDTTSAAVLHYLSKHYDVEVRMAVADNKNTHAITAMQLARDDNPDLRYALAENHQLDSRILDMLTKDENPFVADRAQKTLLRIKQVIS